MYELKVLLFIYFLRICIIIAHMSLSANYHFRVYRNNFLLYAIGSVLFLLEKYYDFNKLLSVG